MNGVHIFGSLFALAVGFGVLAMALRNPPKTNALFGAGATTVVGVTNALEGRGH